MSVSAQLLRPPEYRYPHIRSGFEWSSYSLDNLAIEKFYDFRFAKADITLTVYAGGPEDSEEEKTQFIEGVFKGAVINQDYLEEDVIDFSKIVTDIRLFISHDGAYLLQQHKKLVIEKNQLAIFVEIPDSDVFSKQVMLIKAGESAKKYSEAVFKHYMDLEYFTLTEEQTKQLISSAESGKALWDQVISFTLKPIDYVVEISIDVLSSLVEFFGDTIRIEEKHWNKDSEGYTVERIEELMSNFLRNEQTRIENWLQSKPELPDVLKIIAESASSFLSGIVDLLSSIQADIRNVWSQLCGFWNGLVDLISGVFGLLKLILHGLEGVKVYSQNRGYYRSLALEYLDNLWQAILDINWREWLIISISKTIELARYLNQLPDIIKRKIASIDINHTEIAYYGGYMVFEVLSYLFPLIKMGKIKRATERVMTVMEEITGGVMGASNVGGNITKVFFKQMDTIIEDLKGGSQKLEKFFDDLLATLRKQTDEVLEAFNAPKIFKEAGIEMRILKERGKEITVLQKRGERIFEGSQKEIIEIAERLKGKTAKEAREILYEVADKTRKLKKAIKMWKDFEYHHLLHKPPIKIPCFLAGTQVRTQEGYKSIETLKEGELVWSCNIKTNLPELQPIVQTFRGKAEKYVKITTTEGQEIEVTGTHRFYQPQTKKWKEATVLSLGDYMYDAIKDEKISIQAIERIEQEVETYNLEVSHHHNYMVSEQNILAHNNNKKLKYNSLDEFFFEFYTLNDRITKTPLYGGITTQELAKRYVQHIEEGKRSLNGIKSYYKWKVNTEISSVVLKNVTGKILFASGVGGVKMTYYEAKFIEQYILSYYGGAMQEKGLGKLLNRSNAMSKNAFKNYKSKFNPCQYFV